MATERIRSVLLGEHVRLEAAMTELANSVEGADPAALTADWRRFERALIDHLELEEHDILPAVEPIDPSAIARVREDHAAIRTLVDELGVEVELHTLREETVDRFLALLRAHAAHEDATIYRAADALRSSELARRIEEHAV